MISTYLSNLILNHIAQRGSSINLGDDIYLALSTTLPTAAGTNVTEPSAAHNYARALLGKYGQSETLKLGTPLAGVLTNSQDIHFAEVRDGSGTGDWGTCTHFAIYDAATNGNMLFAGALPAPIDPDEGEIVIVRASSLTITIS